MSVTALMNRFCAHGYDVTLISETVCNIKYDFKYDHRVKRLSFSMGVKNCATRAELLAHFVAQMPPSVFILTDFSGEEFRAYPAVIKAQSAAHKIILLPHFLFASLLDKRPPLLEELRALIEKADAVVSNTLYAHVSCNERLGGRSVWFPYFYPYGEGEYRPAPPGGKSVLLLGRDAELIAGTMAALAGFMKSEPELTLKIAAGRIYGKAAEAYTEHAQALGLENRVVYEESDRFDDLAQDCAFAVVTSKFVFPGDAYVQLAARRVPVLFASTYREPVFLSADMAQTGDLAGKCAALLTNSIREENYVNLSEEAANHTFAWWEALVNDLAAGRAPRGAVPPACDEAAFLAHFDGIFTRERPESIKNRRTLRQRLRRLKRRLKQSWPARFIKKKIYWRERFRVQKYAHMQMSPEQVRKAQLLALKMLYEFERICKKYGLRYYVAAGSLLGAARHGGQIPWDDDVDVTMPRPDYDKFLEVVRDELPADMELPNNYPYTFHRICMKGTKITRYIRQDKPNGIFLDFLPLDGAAPTQKKKDKHWKRSQRLFSLMLDTAWPQPPLIPTLKRVYIWTRRWLIKHFVSKRLLYRLWERNAKKYSTESAAEWVCLPGMYGYEKECFPKEYWGEPALLPYEGREVPVMREWETYLISHYRDYMTPPPVLFRRTHTLFSVDFGRYEAMTVEELQQEVDDFGRETGVLL